jgi:hypothetical protein
MGEGEKERVRGRMKKIGKGEREEPKNYIFIGRGGEVDIVLMQPLGLGSLIFGIILPQGSNATNVPKKGKMGLGRIFLRAFAKESRIPQ